MGVHDLIGDLMMYIAYLMGFNGMIRHLMFDDLAFMMMIDHSISINGDFS